MQVGPDKGKDAGRPAVKSRLKTGDFALERNAATRLSTEERLQEIHCAPLASWADDPACWLADPTEAEDPVFEGAEGTAGGEGHASPRGRRHQQYLYKDIISVVPSPEELEAMQRAREEAELLLEQDASLLGSKQQRQGSSRSWSSSSASSGASSTTTASGHSDSDDEDGAFH